MKASYMFHLRGLLLASARRLPAAKNVPPYLRPGMNIEHTLLALLPLPPHSSAVLSSSISLRPIWLNTGQLSEYDGVIVKIF